MEALEHARCNKLTALMKRLEAATSRLEDLATSSVPLENEKALHGTSTAAVSRVASINGDIGPSETTPKAVPAASPTLSVPDLPRQVEDFDELIKHDLSPFQNISARIGGTVAESV